MRAFKSAIFGTPARDSRENDEKEEPQEQVRVKHGDLTTTSKEPRVRGTKEPIEKNVLKPDVDLFASPSKGILLTPGIGSTRRKTVSFGALANNHENGLIQVLEDCKDLQPTPSNASQSPAKNFRQSTLNKALFKDKTKVQAIELVKAAIQKPETVSESLAMPATQGKSTLDVSDIADTDVTIDLKDPRSRSGQHWKVQYERYHEKSNREMKRLIKYTQVAKSYAVKKDSEAIDLSEKLKKELSKVAQMETRVSDLASQLVNGHNQSGMGTNNQMELLDELTTQTTLSLRYKQKAEKYKKAIHEQTLIAERKGGGDDASQAESKPLLDEDVLVEDHSTAERLRALHLEIAGLQGNSSETEKRAALLEQENTAMKNTIRRVKEEMKGYELRHHAREERRKRKDQMLENQKIKIREELTQSKLDCQQQISALKEAHSQELNKLLQEIESLKEKRTHWTRHSAAFGSAEQRASFEVTQTNRLREHDHWQKQRREQSTELRQPQEHTRHLQAEDESHKQQPKHDDEEKVVRTKQPHVEPSLRGKSPIDIWTNPKGNNPPTETTETTNDVVASSNHAKLDINALKEIDQNVATEATVQVTKHNSPFNAASKAAMDCPLTENHERRGSSGMLDLPSPEASTFLPRKEAWTRPSVLDSPRPSMLGFSPQKYHPPGSRLRKSSLTPKTNAAGAKSVTDIAMGLTSSRATSLVNGKTRSLLPPDRAAAARMRLQQRNVERRRLRGNIGKIGEL